MKTKVALICLGIFLTGCLSTVPGAEKVIITKDRNAVLGCKVIPKQLPIGVTDNDFRNAAYSLGADTILAPQYIFYNCSGVDNRQPIPVTNK